MGDAAAAPAEPTRLSSFLTRRGTLAMLFGIIALGVWPRSSHLERPMLLDLHAWRQADSAAFIHGYLIDSFNLFSPSIDRHPCHAKDRAFGRVEAELPIVPYLAAAPLRLLGATQASATYVRSVSIVVYILGCFALFACMRELGAAAADALLAVAAFSAAPLAIFFTRSPQPDGQSLSVACAAIWALARYLSRAPGANARQRALDLGLVFAFTTLLLLMKVSNAYLGLVMVYVVVARRAPRAWLREGPLLLAAGLACGAAALWYVHAHSFGWSFGVWSNSPRDKKFAELVQFADPGVWRKLLERLSWDILTAAGCVLAAIGLAARSGVAYVRVAAVWFASSTLFIVVTLNAQLRHVYYQLCWIPPAALAQAAGARFLWSRGAYGRIGLGLLLAVHGAISFSVLWGRAPNASVEGASYFSEDTRLREPIEALRKYLPDNAMFVTEDRDPRLYWNSGHRGYFSDSGKLSDIRRCMDGTTNYLLVGARLRAHLKGKESFNQDFEELWSNQAFGLYRVPQ